MAHDATTPPTRTDDDGARPGRASSISSPPRVVEQGTHSIRPETLPPPRRLILYSHEIPGCSRLGSLFARHFETHPAKTEGEFLEGLRVQPDAAVLCFCSARDDLVDVLLRLAALAGPIPTLACCRAFSPDFVHLAASRGVTRLLLCTMRPPAVRRFVLRSIRAGGIREFLESQSPSGLHSSPHVVKLLDEIVRSFPRRPTTGETARRLGIKARRLQTICRETFDRSFTHLLRLVWVHQALEAMQKTRLDSTEIALWLGYQDETSLARIFRKELGYSPSEARRRLARQAPGELLLDGRPRT